MIKTSEYFSVSVFLELLPVKETRAAPLLSPRPTDTSRVGVFLHDELHVSVSAGRRGGGWEEEEEEEGFSSSRNNPIPREVEPNFHPAAPNFTGMTTALN